MMGLGLPELLIIFAILLVLFGANRVPGIMENFAKGMKAFKKGLKDKDD
jgi:sec-independent protein translocase protein TatA